ncbi:PH domain-containing protein [Tardiphaga alba]|uniref:PH domain-containing protein n=1 Tax=Tardiphaga alba TaxID=340268 RepID=A0ABX8AEW5_9BRAD|nr:PH domain-containing protein [Tardiphaga alba]QUS41826.1 PH domain-containing protein [Tardiphaga alba]
MGRYIDDILQPDEKVLYSSNLHWVVYWKGILGWIVAAALFVGSGVNPALTFAGLVASGVIAVVAFFFTVSAWFQRWITETDVTNLRVVHKTGFITRKTFEISVDKIAGVNVEQGILGRILNYGDVNLESMGDQDQNLKLVASPLKFRNAITAT